MDSNAVWESLTAEEKSVLFMIESYRAFGWPLPVDVYHRAIELELIHSKEEV